MTIRSSLAPVGAAIALSALVGVLVGCTAVVPAAPAGEPTSASTQENPMLTGTLWAWQATTDGDSAVAATDPSRYTVTFLDDGSLAILADCNRVGGSYSVDGDALTITLGPSTLIGCPPGSQADAFLAALSAATAFSLNAETLTLTTGSGAMRFAELLPTALVGTSWQVWGYNNGKGGVTTPVEGSQLSATFTADGAVGGSAGCNSFRGSFTVDGDTISFGPMMSTRKACAPELMTQEQQFMAALQKAASFSISANTLTIRDAEGARLVELRAGEV